MGVNIVKVGDEVKLSLADDTVSENNLLAGATAHNAAGEPITGAVVVAPIDSELSEISENAVQNKVVTAALNNKANKSEIPASLPANGGNADTVDDMHAKDFAKAVNPTIDGECRLIRSGNNTTVPMIFAWEDSIRIRNILDESAANHTYTDLIVTPSGVYIESMTNGNHQARRTVNSGICVTGTTTNVAVVLGFQPSAVLVCDSLNAIYMASAITATGFECSFIPEGTHRAYWAFR